MFQEVLAEDVEEGLLPAGVEGGVDVEEQWNQGTDVLDRYGLRVEVEEDGGFLLKEGVLKGRVVEATVAMVRGVGVGILRGRRCGRGPLSSRALLRGAKTGGGGVEISLSSGSFPLGFLGTGQGGNAGRLFCARLLCSDASGACSVGINIRRAGGGSFGGVVIDGGHGARLGGHAKGDAGGQHRGARGAVPVGKARMEPCRQRKENLNS